MSTEQNTHYFTSEVSLTHYRRYHCGHFSGQKFIVSQVQLSMPDREVPLRRRPLHVVYLENSRGFSQRKRDVEQMKLGQWKKCPKCREEKPVADFNKRLGDLLQAYCKVCDSERAKARYHAVKAKRAAQAEATQTEADSQ